VNKKERIATVLAIATLAIAGSRTATADPPPPWVGQEINIPG
jgi:hypothetical protein